MEFNPYSTAKPWMKGYPQWMLLTFGWGAAALVVVVGFALARVGWREGTRLEPPYAATPDTEGR